MPLVALITLHRGAPRGKTFFFFFFGSPQFAPVLKPRKKFHGVDTELDLTYVSRQGRKFTCFSCTVSSMSRLNWMNLEESGTIYFYDVETETAKTLFWGKLFFSEKQKMANDDMSLVTLITLHRGALWKNTFFPGCPVSPPVLKSRKKISRC